MVAQEANTKILADDKFCEENTRPYGVTGWGGNRLLLSTGWSGNTLKGCLLTMYPRQQWLSFSVALSPPARERGITGI